jgi:ABC-type uncharacterized transport system substrate-binding protein
MISRSQLGLLMLAVLVAGYPCSASGQEVPAKIQSAILYKLLAYDKNLPARCKEGVIIGIIAHGATAQDKTQILSALLPLSAQKVQNKSIRVVMLDVANLSRFEAVVQAQGANILYVQKTTQREAVKKTIALAGKEHIPTFCGSEELVQRGLAVGFAVYDGKPKIVVNLAAMKKQGLNLPAEVLQLAKVIR